MGLTKEARRRRDWERGPMETATCCINFYSGHRNVIRWSHCRDCGKPLVYHDSKHKEPEMNGTLRVIELFANVPVGPVSSIEGRLKSPDNHVVEPVTGPIESPGAWLEHHLIPIRYKERAAMDGALALFRQCYSEGKHVEAEVWIPHGTDINDEDGRWSVWHEIGHAVDQVQVVDGKLVASAHGSLSLKHGQLLGQYAPEIVKWNPHPNPEYKNSAKELFAEIVACMICEPGQIAKWHDVWIQIGPDLRSRNLPVPMLPATPTVPFEVMAAVDEEVSHEDKLLAGRQALRSLKRLGFIGGSQCEAVRELMEGEEGVYYAQLMIGLSERVDRMPKTYESDGQGKEATAWLRYFAGGSASWHITEKDKGSPDDEKEGVPPQSQAFGLCDLGYGGELGYVSIAEIIQAGGELDFHFDPTPLSQISRA